MTVDTRADDWNDLAAAWQAPHVQPPVDIMLLRRHVALMLRRAMSTMAGEALLTLVFVAEYVQEAGKLAALAQLVTDGKLTLRVAAELPAEHAGAAHRRLEAGGTRGRLVLTF